MQPAPEAEPPGTGVDRQLDERPRPLEAATVFALIPGSPAAQEERFLPFPAAATHSGYRNILAIPEIGAFLHPEAFEGA